MTRRRELAAVAAVSGAAGAAAGIGAYYLVDRIRVLTGHSYRDLRHAGWLAARRTR